MVSHAHSSTTLFEVIGQLQDPGFLRLGRTATWSLLVHLAIVALVVLIRLPMRGEQPIRSVEVSLVSLPPVPRPVEPQSPAAPPQTQPVRPPPVTKQTPPPKVDVPSPPKVSGDIMRDLLRDIALPPDAPRIGELSPSQPVAEPKLKEPKPQTSPEKLRPNLDSVLKKLQVPELSALPQAQAEKPAVPTATESQSSLTDELKRELDQELKKLAPKTLPKSAVSTKDVNPSAATAKIPTVKTPDVTLQVPGLKTGTSAYLARVQQLISSNWDAPPVNVSGRVLTVTVRFRLHRDGGVSAVVVEESSGNEYYDLAGKRAVLRTGQLPPFPPDVKESHFDAHFTFAVGRSAG